MAENSRRRNTVIAIVVLLLLILIALLLTRCPSKKPLGVGATSQEARLATPPASASTAPSAPAATEPVEVLTPATVVVPQSVMAGAVFSVTWTGPDNRGDYITVVRSDAPTDTYGNYHETNLGKSLELTAPIEPGPHEVRYVTGRSHTILGRALIEVAPAGATLDAADEVVLGSPFVVNWTGPNNAGDYITIVAKDDPDEKYGNYTNTDKGSPMTLAAPTITGAAEVRYVASQGRKVLARRSIQVIAAHISLSAPDEAIAGTTIEVSWTGPNNAGDYITVVSSEIPDGQHGNYTNTSTGSPLKLLLPIMDGSAELRYMTGQGGRVLLRRPITIVAAKVTLFAPPECALGSDVSITWTGPNNPGDYITLVSKATPDGQYASYTLTATGSPLSVTAPKQACEAEIRYMTGQGNKVLARVAIRVH